MEQIIFNILLKSAHNWVRYWIQKEINGFTLPGEYIEIRTHYMPGDNLQELFDAGFKIKDITPKKIDADCYCDILLKRELNYSNS
ncbi:MAG: hypothetical protein ACK5KL_09155 [Dysgonomonas sp.]